MAGGYNVDNVTNMGNASVNSSIGGSWSGGANSRINQLREAANKQIEAGNGDYNMNISLSMK